MVRKISDVMTSFRLPDVFNFKSMNERYVWVLIERTTDVKSTDREESHLCQQSIPPTAPSVEMNQAHYDNMDNFERIQLSLGTLKENGNICQGLGNSIRKQSIISVSELFFVVFGHILGLRLREIKQNFAMSFL